MKKRVGAKRPLNNAVASAFGNRIGIWWYRLSDGKLEYSAEAVTHLDHKRFTAPNSSWRGWARGFAFMNNGKRSIFVYMQDSEMKNVLDQGRCIADIKNKISKKISFAIGDVIDENGRSLV